MMTSVLTFGPSQNATIWSRELARQGVRTGMRITRYEPRLAELVNFCEQSPDWIYFTGHYIGGHLFNYFPREPTAGIHFHADHVRVHAPDGQRVLQKGRGFHLHMARNKVIMFGACSVCHDDHNQIPELRALFDNPLILAYARSSVWRTNRLMFTGKRFNPQGKMVKFHRHMDFFDQLAKGDIRDPEHVRKSWLRAVIAMIKTPARQTFFRAVDPDGREWKVEDGEMVQGRDFASLAARPTLPDMGEAPALQPIPLQ